MVDFANKTKGKELAKQEAPPASGDTGSKGVEGNL